MKRLSRKILAEEYSYSTRTIDRRLKEIDQLIGIRYPANAITWAPTVRIREDVARDYLENRTLIRAGRAPAFIGG